MEGVEKNKKFQDWVYTKIKTLIIQILILNNEELLGKEGEDEDEDEIWRLQ